MDVPNDLIFVSRGLIFGLSEEQSKSAISQICRSVILKGGKIKYLYYVLVIFNKYIL